MFHLSTKPISRSSGRSAVASIAYRAGIEITDQRTGRTFDYRKRTGVIATNLITPNNLPISRSDLWNKAELIEKRSNSRTARETVINIPYELMAGNGAAGYMLVNDFAKHLSDKYNIAVDVAIHAPDKHGDQRNYHAHLLMTTRQLERAADGSITLGKKSQLEMSNTQLKNLGLLSCQDELKEIRETWANFANKALAEHNIDKRIDHRSHKDRGLQELPTIKLGWKATELERQGIPTAAGDYNRAVKEYNETLKEIEQTKAAIKQNAINERIKPLERAERVSATQVPPQPPKSTVGENRAISDGQKPVAKPAPAPKPAQPAAAPAAAKPPQPPAQPAPTLERPKPAEPKPTAPPPAERLDPSGKLTDKQLQERQGIITAWLENVEKRATVIFNNAVQALKDKGKPLFEKLAEIRKNEPLMFGKDKWRADEKAAADAYNQVKDNHDKTKAAGVTLEHRKQAEQQIIKQQPQAYKRYTAAIDDIRKHKSAIADEKARAAGADFAAKAGERYFGEIKAINEHGVYQKTASGTVLHKINGHGVTVGKSYTIELNASGNQSTIQAYQDYGIGKSRDKDRGR